MKLRPLAVTCLLASLITVAPPGGASRAEGLSPAALIALAHQAEAEQRVDRAVALFRQAHEADPFDPAPLTALGRLSVLIGAADEAVEYFQAALTIERRDRDARRGLADAFVELDRAEDALAVFEALLAEDASDGRAWNGKGMALDLAGRYAEAQAAYRAGLAVAPESEEIRANLDISRTLAAVPAEPAASPGAVTLALNSEGMPASTTPPSIPAGRDP